MISISVVMPTYNTEITILQEAVDSILSQTFRDFEFIIIDDCSTDDSYDYLQSLSDERIRLIRNPQNLGITKSLNIGFKEAKGKYIARMDSDDISLPTRFEKQFAYMESHPDVIVCGTGVKWIGERSDIVRQKITDMDDYRIRTLFYNPGPFHPTAFFNRELLLRYHIAYDERLPYAQDYNLWSDICRIGPMYILEDVLLLYRMHRKQISGTQSELQRQCHKSINKKLLCELLGDVSEEELDLHFKYSSGYYRDVKVNKEMKCWFHKLVEANDRVGVYDKKKFERYVFNNIVEQIIFQSFDQNMSFASKAGLFFRYLPFPMALTEVLRWIKIKMSSIGTRGQR